MKNFLMICLVCLLFGQTFSAFAQNDCVYKKNETDPITGKVVRELESRQLTTEKDFYNDFVVTLKRIGDNRYLEIFSMLSGTELDQKECIMKLRNGSILRFRDIYPTRSTNSFEMKILLKPTEVVKLKESPVVLIRGINVNASELDRVFVDYYISVENSRYFIEKLKCLD